MGTEAWGRNDDGVQSGRAAVTGNYFPAVGDPRPLHMACVHTHTDRCRYQSLACDECDISSQ